MFPVLEGLPKSTSCLHVSNLVRNTSFTHSKHSNRGAYIKHKVLICASHVHLSHVNAAETDRLYIVLQPAQLLKGDIMVSCDTLYI